MILATGIKKYIGESEIFKDYNPSDFNLILQKAYDSIVKRMRKAPILTIGGSYNFDPGFNINIEYLKGIWAKKNKTAGEIDIRGDVFDSSTTNSSRRGYTQLTAGINLSLFNKKNISWIEIKGSYSPEYVFKDLKPNEKALQLTSFTGTIRFRVTNDVWIPFDLKYDKSGFFGFLSMKVNFSALNKKSS